jgi:hypothetical protein
MGGTQEAWNEVGERFASWGRHVADRYKESTGSAREAAQESQRKLEEAAHDITDALDRAFTALGETIRDENAKSDLKDAVKALGDAVAVTVSDAGAQIRKRVGGAPTTPNQGGPSGANGPDESNTPSSS